MPPRLNALIHLSRAQVQRELNRLSHSVEGNDEAPQPIFTTSMNFETCLGGEGNVALYPNAAAEALIDMDDLPFEGDDFKYISSDHIAFVISLEDTVTGVIKLLCGLVAKAEGSDMHAPDDDMTPGATPEIMPCESTVAHIIDTPGTMIRSG
ncbi:hypothetical protein PPROV_000278200 [Pycnococcus provasolii]|uniref:Uncharacterized protein n=1 Tax=Pycnococcus provasolii TaxID=41880 RepID=A0A830HBB0_9CHLO|nr:hypothetical protein PPROV_000278200 [Pycnococcus provasolii]